MANSPPTFFTLYGFEIACIMLTMALWGITCMQTFIYILNFPKDKLRLKLVVLWLWVTDTVHQALLVVGAYKIIAGLAESTDGHQIFTIEFTAQDLPTILVICSAKAFFAHRIWILSHRNRWFAAFMVPAILCILFGGIAASSLSLYATSHNQGVSSTSRLLISVGFGISALVDIIIAVLMTYYLWSPAHSSSGLPRQTRTIAQRLIFSSINAGIWPAIVSVATILLVLFDPSKSLFTGTLYVLSPIYCNSVLGSLNARPYLRSVTPTNRSEGGVIVLGRMTNTDIRFTSGDGGETSQRYDGATEGTDMIGKSEHPGQGLI